MICDGAGPQIDFERFAFDSSLGQPGCLLTIEQLTLRGTAVFQTSVIDNLALQTVPEPNSVAPRGTLHWFATGFVRRRRYTAGAAAAG